MCTQVMHLYTCGHRSFKRFDNCPRFGQGCFGAGGSSNHKDEELERACHDCKLREDIKSQRQRNREHSQQGGGGGDSQSPGGGSGDAGNTPDSSGGASVGGGGGGDGGQQQEGEQDPWWEGDPWRKYRRG